MTGQIVHKGVKAPIQAGRRRPVERSNAWHNFTRRRCCYEWRQEVIDAFFDLVDAIITVRSLIRQAWTHTGGIADRCDDRDHLPIRAALSRGVWSAARRLAGWGAHG